MEALGHLAGGFAAIFTPTNLMVMIIGLVLGMLVAVLPGLTLVMGVVLALPFTYKMGVGPALILLTAMYVAGTYGGAITAILFRIPGEPMDVPLLWDGYEMTRKGLAAVALGWALLSAFFAGLISSVVMVALTQPIAKIALTFSSPEFFAVVFFGLASVVTLSGASMVNSLISLCLGLLIATVGVDGIYGSERFAFGLNFLQDGIEFLLVMVGAYGIGEVLTRMQDGFKGAAPAGRDESGRILTAFPRWVEVMKMKATFVRGTLTGIIVGIIPGAGATVSSFVAYGIESQYGKNRKELGKGAPEGIVCAKAAATASVGGAFIPLLAMGIPGSGATAIILAAFLLHGIQPGPQVFTTNPALIYLVFASVFVATVGKCILGYFAIKPLCKVLEAPEAIVSAFVVVFCFVGAFAQRNSLPDLYVMAAFGLLGYLFERFKFPLAPLVLGTILGPLAENNFMTTMVSYNNDWTVFFTRPVSGVILALSIVGLAWPVARAMLARRKGNPMDRHSLPDSPSPAAQLVSALVARARAAQAVAEGYDQARVDELVAAAGWAILEPGRNRELAELAVRDTGIGDVADKVLKNHRKTLGLLRDLDGMKTVGVISEDRATGVTEIARPVGVVCAVTPSTNPAATPANKIINSLKARNAVIVAPSPKGASTCAKLIEYMHAQLDRIGAPRDLVQMLPAPITKETTHELMRQCDLVVATGSQANVRSAYASGTPAFGVGAGNVASIVDETADLDDAAAKIVQSKTFDNATSCSSENSVVLLEAIAEPMLAALKRLGCVMLGDEDRARLEACMWPDGKLSPAVIGQSVATIAQRAKLAGPAAKSARVLLVEETGVGPAHKFSGEKLSPVLTVYRARDFADAKDIVRRIYAFQGAGHSVSLHSKREERALDLGLTLPVARVIVNQVHCVANGGSFSNGLPVSLSMGCGTWGGNNFSDNMNVRQYMNVTRVARPIPKVPGVDDLLGKYFQRWGK